MDELEVLEDLERGLVDEPEMDAQEVQTDNGGDDARGLDEGEAFVSEVSDEVAANDGADAGKVVALGATKVELDPWPDRSWDALIYNQGTTDIKRVAQQIYSSTSALMSRMDTLEGNVIAAVDSGGSGSGTSFDGEVTLTSDQWDYLQGSLQASNTFACFSLLITCALLGVLLFSRFFGRVDNA